jgi:ribonuclease HI
MSFKIYTDGASRGNPGLASAGGVIYSQTDEIIAEISKPLGIQTNNVAEYLALKLTLERALELGINNAEVFMDSKLVVEQIQGRWKIKNERLREINDEIKLILTQFQNISFKHIPRNLNKMADQLANMALNGI